MPNWCDQDLIVTSYNEKELLRFKKFAKNRNGALDAKKFIPYPVALETMDEVHSKHQDYPDGYNHGGYDWCIQHWGTKWNFHESIVEEDFSKRNKKLIYGYMTAWAPSTPVIQKMSEMFPKLTFKLAYFEGGMCFSGRCVFKSGELIKEKFNGNYRGDRGG